MVCPLAVGAGGAATHLGSIHHLYQLAYQQAQQAQQTRPQPRPIFERDLFAVWN
jgi:hypothetical protein